MIFQGDPELGCRSGVGKQGTLLGVLDMEATAKEIEARLERNRIESFYPGDRICGVRKVKSSLKLTICRMFRRWG